MECKLVPGHRVQLKRDVTDPKFMRTLVHGRVYVVQEVLIAYGHLGPMPCVRLEDVHYPRLRRPHPTSDGRKAHLAYIFERVTDISSLTALLDTQPIDELVEG